MMTFYAMLWLFSMVIWRSVISESKNNYCCSEIEASKFLDETNHHLAKLTNQIMIAHLKLSTNKSEMLVIKSDCHDYMKSIWNETMKYPWSTYTNQNIKRQFKLLRDAATDILPKNKNEKLKSKIANMGILYMKANLHQYSDEDLNITLNLKNDENHEECRMKQEWIQRRVITGKEIRSTFPEYVKLLNEEARLKKFRDNADFLMREYGNKNFQSQLKNVWRQIKPLYLQMHAYTRKKLRDRFGSSVVARRGPIPAHLIDEVLNPYWKQWDALLLPYPDVNGFDVTLALEKQNYNIHNIYKLSEDFFTSLNLSINVENYKENPILEKPDNLNDMCSPLKWNFYLNNFINSQNSSVNFEDFSFSHIETGRILYYLQYKNQPFLYQDEVSEQVIGETIMLSVMTTKHLHKIGLLVDMQQTYENVMNNLFSFGFRKIVDFPKSYFYDEWNQNVFKGLTTEGNYNCDWWKNRYSYEGVEPPVTRSENDFDPGSHFRMGSHSFPLNTIFIRSIIEFQLHQFLCEKAGQFDPSNPKIQPLHECDIYQSVNAGNALKAFMKLGSSKPWYEALELLTGQRAIDAGPLLNYFNPLYEWLKNENKKTEEYIGWEINKKLCQK